MWGRSLPPRADPPGGAMTSTQLASAADAAARLPLRVLGALAAAVGAAVGGLALALWYGVLFPVLWLLVGVPYVAGAAFVTRREHSRGHLRRRLRAHRKARRSARAY